MLFFFFGYRVATFFFDTEALFLQLVTGRFWEAPLFPCPSMRIGGRKAVLADAPPLCGIEPRTMLLVLCCMQCAQLSFPN